MTHGFFVRVLDPRDTVWGRQDEYQQFVDDLVTFFEPDTNYELNLIELLAVDHIRLRRALQLEASYFDAPTLESIKTKQDHYAIIQYGSPEEHEYQIKVLKQVQSMVETDEPLLIPDDDAQAIARRLGRSLGLSLKRWLDYIPTKRGLRPRRLYELTLDQREAAVCRMLTEDKRVREKEKRIWIKGIEHALNAKRTDLKAAHEREAIAPELARQTAAEWQRADIADDRRSASLRTLGEYETRLRRSIERGLKILVSLKTARQQWSKEDDEVLSNIVTVDGGCSSGSFFRNADTAESLLPPRQAAIEAVAEEAAEPTRIAAVGSP